MPSVYYDNTANEAIQASIGQVVSSANNYADLMERRRAQRIQNAVEDTNRAQQQKNYEREATRRESEEKRQADYQQYQQQRQEKNDALGAENTRLDNARADRSLDLTADYHKQSIAQQQAELNSRNKLANDKLSATTASTAAKRAYVAANHPESLAFFDAFGKLPTEGDHFLQDPATYALAQNSSALRQSITAGEVEMKKLVDKDFGTVIPGREADHAALSQKLAQWKASKQTIDADLYTRRAKLAGVNAPNPFGDGSQPQPAPGVQFQNGGAYRPGPAPAAQAPADHRGGFEPNMSYVGQAIDANKYPMAAANQASAAADPMLGATQRVTAVPMPNGHTVNISEADARGFVRQYTASNPAASPAQVKAALQAYLQGR
jgi:hypothetical protein